MIEPFSAPLMTRRLTPAAVASNVQSPLSRVQKIGR
jgi:hypothetical protein